MSHRAHNFTPAYRGFTLIEAVFSIVLVSVMMVAAMSAVSASAIAQSHSGDATRGNLLAQALMSEIVVQPYSDPNVNSTTIGPDPGDTTSPATRSKFNDVDDYDGWYESPPQKKDGTLIGTLNADGTVTPAYPGWSRRVGVVWVNASDLKTPVRSETGVKRITVTVLHNGAVMSTCVAIRAKNPS